MTRPTAFATPIFALALCSLLWLSSLAPALAATVTDTFPLTLSGREQCRDNPKFVEPITVKVKDGATLTVTRDLLNTGDSTDIQATINNSGNATIDAMTLKGRALPANKAGSTAQLVLSGRDPGNPDHFMTLRGTATFKAGNLTNVTGKFVYQILSGLGGAPNIDCLGSGTFGAQKPPSSGGGGGGGTLTVANAPGSVKGTFVAFPQATSVTVQGTIGAVGWGEVDSRNLTHTEVVTISFDTTSGQVLSVLFSFADSSVGNAWGCNASLPPGCVGASVDRTAGTFTVVNTELRGNILIPPITLNGTLTFPPGVVPVTITSLSPLPAGTVGIIYSTILVAFGGRPPLSWSVISGALPVELKLDPSTGLLSGVPTTLGTSTFTIRAQDSGTPKQSAQKQFSLTINAVSSGGGGGTLTVANAPADVGGTFVADPLTSSQVTTLGSELLNWSEAPSQNLSHFEGVSVSFNLTDEKLDFVQFFSNQGTSSSIWICFTTINGLNVPCSGVTFNRTAGTVNFANTVVTDIVNSTPPTTLNGTLTFTPF